MVVRNRTPSGVMLSRRRVLQLMAATGAAVALPLRARGRLVGASTVQSLPPRLFLTAKEVAILDAATSTILPSNGTLGAHEVGVVDYVQSLLSFFPGTDANCDHIVNAADVIAVEAKAAGQPLGCAAGGDVNGDESVDEADVNAIEAGLFRAHPAFAGGPFSGRNPQPHFPIGTTACVVCHGVKPSVSAPVAAAATTVDAYPPNAFRQFLPLNRLQSLSWNIRINGRQAAPDELKANPLLDELPEVDLRQRYRNGLAQLESRSQSDFQKSFVLLSLKDRRTVLQRVPSRFLDLLNRHVIQAVFCAPEYGGNHDRLGWQLTGFDGDSQPLGYEIYDYDTNSYSERPEKPNSGPNPGEACSEFSQNMKDFLTAVSLSADGGPFDDPYCFEVDG